MFYLKEHRSVAKSGASFGTLSASNAQFLIDHVLIVRLFDEFPFYGSSGAELIFGCRGAVGMANLQIAPAKIAIAAHLIGMHAFYCRGILNAMSCTASAPGAFERVDLPDRFIAHGIPECKSPDPSQRQHQPEPHAAPDKLPPVFGFIPVHISRVFSFIMLRPEPGSPGLATCGQQVAVAAKGAFGASCLSPPEGKESDQRKYCSHYHPSGLY
jgi:hypothetical protein